MPVADTGTDWNALRRRTPAQIRAALKDDPDWRPVDVAFWEGAVVVTPEDRRRAVIRIASDVFDFFKREKRPQAKINAVLRAYVRARRRARQAAE